MHPLTMLCLLIVLFMIVGMGRWQWNECRRRRRFEQSALRDRDEIREVAESAASEAASCAAVIDRIGAPQPRRKLHVVRDSTTGVSTWNWE